ncbi:mucin-2-like [Hetaerina americana]|uniref:mucin-2-like n=1 Tax=Hetaerina americana TaxID=62018 RepID=UPI003A7F1629
MGRNGMVRGRRQSACGWRLAASPALLLLLLNSAQGARIFRSPEPHLPAEHIPGPSEHWPQAPSLHPDASLPRSAGDPEDYFAPGAWRPVRNPDASSGRRGISPLATSGFSIDAHIASARNLRHEDGEDKVSSGAGTSEASSSVNTPTSTLGHSIALVANQLLQSKSDILESHVPDVSATSMLKEEGHWPHSSLDTRTPPKLMLQVKNAAASPGGNENDKKVVPIQDDPMGENFFPSRRQPATVTYPTPTTSGQVVTQIMVSTMKKNQTKGNFTQALASTPGSNKVDRRPVTPTASTPHTNRKSPPNLTSTIRTSTPMPSTVASTITMTPPQPPSSSSVKWKIAIPPNRQATRFPPRRPIIATTTTPSPRVSSNTESTKKESKPVSTGPSQLRPNAGGVTKPYAAMDTSRRPISTITRVTTTPQPGIMVTPHSTVALPSHSNFVPTSRPTGSTTFRKPAITSTTRPSEVTPARSSTSTSIKTTQIPSTTPAPKKEIPVMVQAKKPLPIEKETIKGPVATEASKPSITLKTESTTSSAPSSTARPRRPSNKRKKNKNRRRRPSKKPIATTQVPSLGTELEVKESPQDDNAGNVASPLSTRIYNFIAREVMPSMSVGLLGLVVTAGLAGYFLLPTLSLQRRSDVANGGFMPGYASSYSDGMGGQDGDDGGIVKTIFQNVMASVSNGEKEFERGPRRRREAFMTSEAENEIDANPSVKEENQNWRQVNQAEVTTTKESTMSSSLAENSDDTSTPGSDILNDSSIVLPEATDQVPMTTEVAQKADNPTQDLAPTYGWEGQYNDYPFTLMGILHRIAEFKLRLGVGLLRATTDVIARYLEDVQHRLRYSDKQDWLRNLEYAFRRIRRNIDPPPTDADEDGPIPYARTRFSRHRLTKRHG